MKSRILMPFAAALSAMATMTPAAAAPTTYTFNTVGSSAVNGDYGNAIGFDTTTASTLKLSVTGWQSNLYTNAITSAYLGAYAGGLGVTGLGDAGGAANLHQIDNVGAFTDFVLMSFNRAVTLTSINTRSYGIGGVSDNDAVWYDAGKFATPTWNATTGFTSYSTVPSLWSDVGAGGSGVSRVIGAPTASSKWLVGAAFGPLSDRNDGFKISSITVSETVAAVPEPATWAMMIVGFGVAGTAMRRTRSRRQMNAAIA